jgi:hypothetical protein
MYHSRVVSVVGTRRVFTLEPGGDNREPASNRLIEGVVGVGRILGEEISDGIGIVRFPCPDIGTQPGGNGFSGQGHRRVAFTRAA